MRSSGMLAGEQSVLGNDIHVSISYLPQETQRTDDNALKQIEIFDSAKVASCLGEESMGPMKKPLASF
jgi:hypothetical protein